MSKLDSAVVDEAIKKIEDASDELPFSDLVELIGKDTLDPERHFAFGDWSDIDFKNSDLTCFNFTGARLINCEFPPIEISELRIVPPPKKDGPADILRISPVFYKAIVDHAAPYKRLDQRRTSLSADFNNPYGEIVQEPLARIQSLSDAHLRVGDVFIDTVGAPEMVVLPDGITSDEEPFWIDDPKDLPDPRISRLAVSRFPITVAEWNVAQTHESWNSITRRKPKLIEDGEFYRYLPATHVSWRDAVTYCAWLGMVTKEHYRLLSINEWNYCLSEDGPSYISQQPAVLQQLGEGIGNAFGLHDLYSEYANWCEDHVEDTPPNKVLAAGGRGHSASTRSRQRQYPHSEDNLHGRATFRIARELHS